MSARAEQDAPHAGAANSASADTIWALLAEVMDPEIPVLSIVDLGVVRAVNIGEGVEVVVTPTYSGCPATDVINDLIRKRLESAGFTPRITIALSPPWTTDWLTQEGRQKLLDYGIAPPVEAAASKRALFSDDPVVACPRCGSANSQRVSEFGSTPCKAHYKCCDCLEPFDYFKCL